MERLPASQPSSRIRFGRRRTGQGLVEFALILPVLLILLFVIVEVARLLHAWLAIENGARFGVRYAVTGEYDPSYCIPLYGAPCSTPAEVDGARIPSITDAAKAGSVAILRDATEFTVGQRGFYKVTICSNRPSVAYLETNPDIPTAAECIDVATLSPVADPGGPGDRVSVTVDFDHPLITPILSEFWPVLHLSAKREGIVEQFRTARVVGLPATISGPTFTPSITPTPSDTPLPSDTPTPTETATETVTPTPSPTPSCANVFITDFRKSGSDDLFAAVHNNNQADAELISTTLFWPDLDAASSAYVNYMEWNGTHYMDSNDSSSPTSAGQSGPAEMLGGGSTASWHADYGNQPPEGIWGYFELHLSLEFAGWGTCDVSASLSVPQGPTPTLTPTRTPSRTPTPGPSPTRTPTRTPSRTPTIGPSPTSTPSRTPTRTPTTGPSPTRTPTASATATSDACMDC